MGRLSKVVENSASEITHKCLQCNAQLDEEWSFAIVVVVIEDIAWPLQNSRGITVGEYSAAVDQVTAVDRRALLVCTTPAKEAQAWTHSSCQPPVASQYCFTSMATIAWSLSSSWPAQVYHGQHLEQGVVKRISCPKLAAFSLAPGPAPYRCNLRVLRLPSRSMARAPAAERVHAASGLGHRVQVYRIHFSIVCMDIQ